MDPPRRPRLRRWLVAAVAAWLVALGGCAPHPEADGRDGIIELEPRSLGFEMGGRLAEVLVERGEDVKAGQPLARLDDSLDRAQRPVLVAQLAGAEARLDLAEAGPRTTEIRAAIAARNAAQTQVESARTELDRVERLVPAGGATEAALDARRTQLRLATAERDGAAQRLKALREGSRSEEVRALAAARDAAQASLDALDLRLTHYELRAPADGRIDDVTALAGEVVGPGAAVLLFTEPDHPYVDLFVPVADLTGIRLGQGAQVRPDGGDGPFPGAVEHVFKTTEYTPHYLLSERERVMLVSRVRVRIQDPERRLHSGLPCKVTLGEGS